MKKVYKYGIYLFLFILFIGILIPIPNQSPKYSASIYSNTGQLLSATVSSEQQWCLPLKDDVPKELEHCILLFEDEYYYKHLGVNPISIAKAFYANIKAKKIVRGGSTITMQVMRMKNRNARRNIKNKVVEIAGAIKYSILHSKKNVLKEWVNIAPFGGNTIGAQAASLRYFNRSLNNLSWAEYAMLAVLPNAPTSVNLKSNRDRLKMKRDRLLTKLSRKGYFAQDELELYIGEDIPEQLSVIPQFAFHALQYLKKGQPAREIHSTIDFEAQLKLNNLLSTESSFLKLDGIDNLAAVIIDVEKNELKAYCGNVNDKSGAFSYVDMMQAQRSYGSLLKPLLYGFAIDQKYLLPKEMVADIPTHIGDFRPENFDKLFRGAVPLDEMVIQSLNVPAVRVLNTVGLQNFYGFTRQLDIKGLDRGADHYGLSLILGGGETSLWELARLYKGMAQNHMGRDHPFSPIKTQKNILKTDKIDFSFSPFTISAVANAMSDLTRPREEKSWELFGIDHKIAWKTGTSYGHKDAWAIGFNGKYVIGVWVGNQTGEGRPRLTGLTRAAPIMFKSFSLMPDNRWFATPPRLEKDEYIVVCRESGKLAGRMCKHRVRTAIDHNSYKFKTCDYHRKIVLNNKNELIPQNCKPQGQTQSDTIFILPSHMEYYYKQGHKEYTGMPPIAPDCKFGIDNFVILYPTNGLKVFLPKESSSVTNKLIAKAHHSGKSKIFWFLDGTYISTSEANGTQQCALSIGFGTHTLTATDEFGNSEIVEFEILSGE